MVKRVHKTSKGSAGARTIATTSTTAGLPMSRYIARMCMQELQLVSCQQPKHRYKKAGGGHTAAPNLLTRQFTPDRPNQV
jgi:putative transposase